MHDSQTLSDLKNDWERDKTFREPIRLSDPADEEKRVLNGTHRVVAAMLNNIEELDVVYESDEKDKCYVEPSIILLKITFNEESQSHEDEYFDLFFDFLRSLKISDTEWVTADLATGSHNSNIKIYYETFDESDENLNAVESKILQVIHSRQELSEAYQSHNIKILIDEDDE